MPSFKHKTTKKIVLDENKITTLDSKHKEIESEFLDNKNDILPNLRAKKRYYKQILNEETNVVKINELNETIAKISNEIKTCKKNMKDYYLNNNQHIFDYFETKKEISKGGKSENTSILNDFFKVKFSEEGEYDLSGIDVIEAVNEFINLLDIENKSEVIKYTTDLYKKSIDKIS